MTVSVSFDTLSRD